MKITEDMINTLNTVCPINMRYQLDEKHGEQRIAVWKDEHYDNNWLISEVMNTDQTVERMKLECSFHSNVASMMMECLKRNNLVAQDCVVKTAEAFHTYSMRQWKPWECWIMQKLNFRFWFCECYYQAPYGKVIMGGCEKHD